MTDWRDRAACRDTEPDQWHLPGDSDTWEQPRYDDHRKALKAICGACPVRDACAVDAIAQGDQHTFRGGMTPNERADSVAAVDVSATSQDDFSAPDGVESKGNDERPATGIADRSEHPDSTRTKARAFLTW